MTWISYISKIFIMHYVGIQIHEVYSDTQYTQKYSAYNIVFLYILCLLPRLCLPSNGSCFLNGTMYVSKVASEVIKSKMYELLHVLYI